ncbi:MAG TPA: M3 family metallopeptidase [Thermoanaerobaculaceae bacterium]|nr:M3 family metallopeptidase [Thermoanaerobaculaceae bacterium]HRS16593.1 M3 family metallopeptidase [Thermoanaerobaculaceae bacterium]
MVDKAEDLAGLSPQTVAAAAETARKAGLEGKWVFTLQPSSLRPFVAYADNRELRHRLFAAYKARADNGNEQDNNRIAARMAVLRAERARLLGYKTFADFQIAEYMAKTPANVYALMNKLWAPAVAKADEDAKTFQAMLNEKHPGAQIEPYDWGYYSEKVKKARYDFDEEALRPYFPLEQVREGVFGLATRLYGLTFAERTDLPKYHPDVRTYEVKEADGTHVGVLVLDYFPRAGKRGGAWSGSLRDACVRSGKQIRPIVTNVASFTPPTADTPALLSRGEVDTLFHEFGHALHGLLTSVRFASLGNVPWDFVELPSQIMEHWVLEPEVVKSYARHYKTGEVLPDDLIARIRKAEKFNQGYGTVGMVSTVLLDLDWHTLGDVKEIDAKAFEKASFERMGMPRYATSFHRTPAFSHIFAGGYAAGYYSYLWSEVLDSDAFEAFKEKGIFDRATAASFRKNILERAGTGDVAEAYRRFRGKDPSVEPLLRNRGLLPGTPEEKPAKAN